MAGRRGGATGEGNLAPSAVGHKGRRAGLGKTNPGHLHQHEVVEQQATTARGNKGLLLIPPVSKRAFP